MHRINRYRPSPALVVASIALLVALGGTSFAAVTLAAPNSVGTRAVINGSLLKQDFKAGQIPAGPAGAPGSALAYAHVNSDGTLDPANSKNVSVIATKGSAQAKPGTYCLDVPPPSRPRRTPSPRWARWASRARAPSVRSGCNWRAPTRSARPMPMPW